MHLWGQNVRDKKATTTKWPYKTLIATDELSSKNSVLIPKRGQLKIINWSGFITPESTTDRNSAQFTPDL